MPDASDVTPDMFHQALTKKSQDVTRSCDWIDNVGDPIHSTAIGLDTMTDAELRAMLVPTGLVVELDKNIARKAP
jgi:hypothetical protein